MLKTKTIAFVALATILVTGLSLSAITAVDAQQAQKKKPQKCNNIKILVNVEGVKENQTYTANVTLGTGMKQKTATVEPNETTITLPVSFKKISPCPPIGFAFGGDVNGTEFSSKIQSLNKPNKVSLSLP